MRTAVSTAGKNRLSIRPTADASSNLATAYFQMHRYGDSAVQFEKAVQLDPTNYIFLGKSRRRVFTGVPGGAWMLPIHMLGRSHSAKKNFA